MTSKARGALTASELKKFQPRPANIERTAEGAPIPLVYGRPKPVDGLNAGYGFNGGGDLIARYIFCLGEIFEFEEIYINGEPAADYVRIRQYRGTQYQGVDSYMVELDAGYDEDLIIRRPEGNIGIAYIVIKIPAANLTDVGAPRVQALIKGHLVNDPRISTQAQGLDPFYYDVGFNFQFIGTNGTQPTTGMDGSQNASTVAWTGATIQSNQASFDGSGDWITSADAVYKQFGSDPFTFEIKFTPAGTTGVRGIYKKTDPGGAGHGFLLYQDGADLKVSASTNGTSYNLINATTLATLTAGVEVDFALDWNGRDYFFHVNNSIVTRRSSTSPIAGASGSALTFGYDGTTSFNGTIRCARLTQGRVRYGGRRSGSALTPYTDSAYVVPGAIYDNIGAMVFRDLATSPLYGLGVDTVNGYLDAYDWNEEIVVSDARSRINLSLDQPRSTDEWLDLIATYCECYWYPDDDSITIVPESPVNARYPSGWEMTQDGECTDILNWTAGDGWTQPTPSLDLFAKTAGTASALSQILYKPFEAGGTYVATLSAPFITAGNVRLELNGVPLIEYVSTAGYYTYEFEATGLEDSGTFRVWADSAFVGFIDRAAIHRKYWIDDSVVKDSLTIQGLSDGDTPTRVTLHYTEEVALSANWAEKTVTHSMPGVNSGDVPLIETHVYLPGVHSAEEASNKCLARLYRLQNRARFSWVTTDLGVMLRKGKVVRLRDPEYSIDEYVRVESVSMTEYGRYRVTGMAYDDSHYPVSIPAPVAPGTIPVGVITPMHGTAVPSGWQSFTAANNRYLIGAGDTYAPTDAGGSASTGSISGLVTGQGSSPHSGTNDAYYSSIDGYQCGTAGGVGTGFLSSDVTRITSNVGGHTHSVSISSFSPDPLQRNAILVKKITSSATTMPGDLSVLGLNGLSLPNLVRSYIGAGSCIRASTSNGNGGAASKSVTATIASGNDSHEHISYITTNTIGSTAGALRLHYPYTTTKGGAHIHTAMVTVQARLKRKAIALYQGTGDFEISQGVVFGWDGSIASIPNDYTLMNGKLGTIDLRNYFLQIAANGEVVGTAYGDNSLLISGATETEGLHNNSGSGTTSARAAVSLSHHAHISHSHNISGQTVSWTPAYYALAFIMYNPDPDFAYIDYSLFIPGGEADGVTTISDESPDALVATVEGTGTLEYDNAQLLFGDTTVLCGGKRLRYTGFEFGRRFTFEGFFRPTALGRVLFGNTIAADNDTFEVRINSGGDVELRTGGTVRLTLDTDITVGEWMYIGLAYDAAEWRLYAGRNTDSAASGLTYSDASRNVTADLYVFDQLGGGANFAGHAGQIRAVRGAAHLKGSAVAVPLSGFPAS